MLLLWHERDRQRDDVADNHLGDEGLFSGDLPVADGSYVKQMVIGTLLGSWRRW